MGKTVIALFGMTFLVGCRSVVVKEADTYVLQEIAFLTERAANAPVEAECPVLPAIEASLVTQAAKLGITVVKPEAGKDHPNKVSVFVDEVVGGRFGNVIGAKWVVSEIYASVSIEDGNGTRERELVCRAGLGVNPLNNLTACDRLTRCTYDIGLKAAKWLQRTR